jgi:hypothetical protein
MTDLPTATHHGRTIPVPWFVPWVEGEPDFRFADATKIPQALRGSLCWVCGKTVVGSNRSFVIGPMCILNRISAEPGCHIECAEFSAAECPFLTHPKLKRPDTSDVPDEHMKPPAGFMCVENPGVVAVYTGKGWTGERHPGGYLVNLGWLPSSISWWHKGERLEPGFQATEIVWTALVAGVERVLAQAPTDHARAEAQVHFNTQVQVSWPLLPHAGKIPPPPTLEL